MLLTHQLLPQNHTIVFVYRDASLEPSFTFLVWLSLMLPDARMTFTLQMGSSAITDLLRTPSLQVISCRDFHVPKPHIPYRKMRQVLNSNPIILRNKVKFNTFFLPWSKMLCCGPIFGELHTNIIRQLKQKGYSLPKQIRQPCWILSLSEGVFAIK